jgi:glycerophosphoryl diester phosphodiesterase
VSDELQASEEPQAKRALRWRPRRRSGPAVPAEEESPPRPPKRVGHKGAGLLAPGNTVAAFDAALAIGVDMIEFDVLRADGELLIAHDLEDAVRPDVLTLEEALDYLASPAFAGIELDVDLKLPGDERQVLDALREHALLERTLISSTHVQSLRTIRHAAPAVKLGLSVPQLRRDPFAGGPLLPFAPLMLRYGQAVTPGGATRALRGRVCDAMMVHWRLVTPRLVRAVAAQRGELYVWTVDNLERVRQLYELGVTGIISNDPRLFGLVAESAD